MVGILLGVCFMSRRSVWNFPIGLRILEFAYFGCGPPKKNNYDRGWVNAFLFSPFEVNFSVTSCHGGFLLAKPFLGTHAYLFSLCVQREEEILQDSLLGCFTVRLDCKQLLFQLNDQFAIVEIIVINILERESNWAAGEAKLSPLLWFTVAVKSFAIYCSHQPLVFSQSRPGGSNHNNGGEEIGYSSIFDRVELNGDCSAYWLTTSAPRHLIQFNSPFPHFMVKQ